MRLFTILLFSFYAHLLMADMPTFDIAKIKVGDEIYYAKFQSIGIIDKSDFCIHYFNNGFTINLQEIFQKDFDCVGLELYKELDIITFYNSKGKWFDNYFLKSQVNTDIIFSDNVVVLAAYDRDNYGMIYNKELNVYDNEWLSYYPLEELFEIYDEGMCFMSFYGIIGNSSKKEIKLMKKKLLKLIKMRKSKGFEIEISKLYHKHILMVGSCSC